MTARQKLSVGENGKSVVKVVDATSSECTVCGSYRRLNNGELTGSTWHIATPTERDRARIAGNVQRTFCAKFASGF